MNETSSDTESSRPISPQIEQALRAWFRDQTAGLFAEIHPHLSVHIQVSASSAEEISKALEISTTSTLLLYDKLEAKFLEALTRRFSF